jgi:coenzyme Q-binding protein COQ10
MPAMILRACGPTGRQSWDAEPDGFLDWRRPRLQDATVSLSFALPRPHLPVWEIRSKMPSFRTSRRVRHSPADMFELVADIEKYPQFVPLCAALRVRSRSTDAEGRTVVVAEMTVSFKLIRETFTSRVTLDRENLQILVEYLDGPFSHMQNKWTFQPDEGEGGCVIEFFIDYAFRSRILGALMGTMFDTAFRRFASAFEQRADVVYGRSLGLAGA